MNTKNTKSLFKRISRHGLEAVVGGVIGWHVANEFVHPKPIKIGDIVADTVSILASYGEQMEYNSIGAIIGAMSLPAIDLIYSAYKKRK